MKKLITAIALGLSILIFTACSGTSANSSSTTSSETTQITANFTVSEKEKTDDSVSETTAPSQQAMEEATTDDTQEILVAYFSYSGNTRAIAEKISVEVGGELFEIDTTYDYPSGYNEVLDVAQQEKSDKARPELSDTVENMGDYDVVFIGYPNWWGDMPMAIYSFLDTYDLSGKTVVPFVTSSSSGFSNTISEITNAEPNAVIAEGLSIRDNAIESSDDAIFAWLEKLNF